MARLLICIDCKTIEELPDYDGPLEEGLVPAPDGTLQRAMVPPQGADRVLDHLAEPHRRQEHRGNLVVIDNKEWHDNATRTELLKQIQEGLTKGVQGLGDEVYAFRNTLQEDALKCFARHGRPETCIDWHDRSKLLGNSLLTSEEKKAAKEKGLTRGAQQKRYLCDFCPVSSKVTEKKFDKQGLYN